MAVLDLERGAVVIRIVYDGPPHAGKTTSMRALARSLGHRVDSPGEVDGRTIFFDWMEYTGGLFEGQPIRCQIVSVPGQAHLAARRRVLLDHADAVVFVADTGDLTAVRRSGGHARSLVDALRAIGDPPVGVVVQANKRDLPGAVARDDVRAALGDDFARAALTESIAESGEGVRETFVFAVRLALDRVRELMARGALPRGRPKVESSRDLLAELEQAPAVPAASGAGSRATSAAPAGAGSRATSAAPTAGSDIASAVISVAAPASPRLPHANVPSGAIWPPVEGRILLHEATRGGLSAHRVSTGDWVSGLGSGWRLHSAAAASFADLQLGRPALVAWARIHAAHAGVLSPARCVVLCPASGDSWRLWQVIKVAPSLRTWLLEAAALDVDELVDRLVFAASALGEALAHRPEPPVLPTLDSIGPSPHGAQIVALLPGPSAPPVPPPRDPVAHVARELSRILAAELVERRAELAEVLAWRAGAPPWHDVVDAAVAAPRIAAPRIGAGFGGLGALGR